jgi:hypothetical protein
MNPQLSAMKSTLRQARFCAATANAWRRVKNGNGASDNS